MKYVKKVSVLLVALLVIVILNAFVLFLILPNPNVVVYTVDWVTVTLLLGGVLYKFNEVVLTNVVDVAVKIR